VAGVVKNLVGAADQQLTFPGLEPELEAALSQTVAAPTAPAPKVSRSRVIPFDWRLVRQLSSI
jgi:hypothetical protein